MAMPLDRNRHLVVKIRDDAGEAFYSASLDFKSGSTNEPAEEVAFQPPSGPRE